MDFFLLGAGKPHSGIFPTVLKKINNYTKTINWQLEVIRTFDKNSKIFLILGYKKDLIKKDLRNIKNINIIVQKNWSKLLPIDTFFSLPIKNKDTFISYADTIFNKSAYEKIINTNGDIVVGVDSNWKNRYPKRSLVDIKLAEEIFINKKSYEFTGLILFRKNIIKNVRNIENKNITNITDLIEYFHTNKFNITYCDIKNDWAEFNLPADVAKFFIKTKAVTLDKLKKKFTIPKQLFFTVNDWYTDNLNILGQIRDKFKNDTIIIRSSSHIEDTWDTSNAGKYLSIQNTNSNNSTQIKKNINKVISSYGTSDILNDHVLVQTQIKNIIKSGVVFTCSLNTGSPYYHINYDEDKNSSDGVTSGRTNNLKKIIISHNDKKFLSKINKDLSNVIKKIKKIEELLIFSKLDIEFLIDSNKKLFFLQVRPITVDHSKFEDKVNFVSEILIKNTNKYQVNKTYSNMTDWNPAEIIGAHPKPLSSNIYEQLITNSVWSQQRYEFGFDDLRGKKLLTFFSGRPYVDVNRSLGSFIPRDLSKKIKIKLLNFYLDILKKNHNLHDKVEFEIVHSVWTPDLKRELKKNKSKFKLNNYEINLFESSLIKITNDAFSRLSKDLKKIKHLNINRSNILNKKIDDFDKIKKLIKDCKTNGTLPFAHVARASFMSIAILKNFIKNNYMQENRVNQFLSSIKTVNKIFVHESSFLKKNQLVKIYGHLREGTYEINQKAYWEDPAKYFLTKKKLSKNNSTFSFNKDEIESIKFYLKKLKSNINYEQFIDYLRLSIENREKLKFEFSKNISTIFDLLISNKKLGKIKRNDLSFIKLKDLDKIKNKKINNKEIQNLINLRKIEYQKEKLIEIPDVISKKSDFYCFEVSTSKANFITLNIVEAEIENLNKLTSDLKENAIVLIPQADPGYDWIFNYNISGLITKYGGANSHMAIRAAEMDIPAAIGVGEILFDQLSNSKRVLLNCENKVINIIR